MLAVAYQFHEQLIFGPALIIALAVCIALVIRYPASRRWMGALLVLMGCVVVFTTLRLVFLWGMLIGLSTLIIGMVFVAKGTASRAETFLSTAKLIGALLLTGTVVILLAVPTTSFAVFIVGLLALIGGAALGAVYLSLRLKKPALRIKIGGVLVAVGVAEIFALWSVMVVWNFIIGLTTLSVGIASCAAGLQPWLGKGLSQRKIHVLKHGCYIRPV
jgi:hypothetical protein